jgi:hypothetical protein
VGTRRDSLCGQSSSTNTAGFTIFFGTIFRVIGMCKISWHIIRNLGEFWPAELRGFASRLKIENTHTSRSSSLPLQKMEFLGLLGPQCPLPIHPITSSSTMSLPLSCFDLNFTPLPARRRLRSAAPSAASRATFELLRVIKRAAHLRLCVGCCVRRSRILAFDCC